MPEQQPDPTPDEIANGCRRERLQWDADQRYEAIADAPRAALTDLADQLYLEELAKGRYLSAIECQKIIGAIEEEQDPLLSDDYTYVDPYEDEVGLPYCPERLTL